MHRTSNELAKEIITKITAEDSGLDTEFDEYIYEETPSTPHQSGYYIVKFAEADLTYHLYGIYIKDDFMLSEVTKYKDGEVESSFSVGQQETKEAKGLLTELLEKTSEHYAEFS